MRDRGGCLNRENKNASPHRLAFLFDRHRELSLNKHIKHTTLPRTLSE